MLVIPAIDMKDGQCVRLRQGRMDDATVFSEDPVAVAREWVEAGARRLHLVDLDGAFAGEPKNASLVKQICKAFPDVPVQVGGGIRERSHAEEYLDSGVGYLIIGTLAVKQPEFVDELCKLAPGKIIVGLDAVNGLVATEGWAEASSLAASAVGKRFEDAGVAAIVYTDIDRDGMMQGPNIEATVDLAKAVNIPVIASGGVSSHADIEALAALPAGQVSGAIVGRALYEGTVDLAKAQARADTLAAEVKARS